MAPGPNLTEATARRASSAVFTCGTCTPITPRSMTLWMSLGELLRGRAIGVMPTASAAIAITSTSPRPMLPCSQSISTQSKPAWPSISTTCGEGNITEQPSAGSPRAIFSFMRLGLMAVASRPRQLLEPLLAQEGV